MLLIIKVKTFWVFQITNDSLFGLALQCYSHNPCSTNCPDFSSTITTCSGDNSRCYKAAFPGGVARGCAKERCAIQVNAFFFIMLQ